jgi:hypothetical protein
MKTHSIHKKYLKVKTQKNKQFKQEIFVQSSNQLMTISHLKLLYLIYLWTFLEYLKFCFYTQRVIFLKIFAYELLNSQFRKSKLPNEYVRCILSIFTQLQTKSYITV